MNINQEMIVGAAEERSAVDMVLKPGDSALAHGLLIHGSQPTRSARHRCGIANVFPPSYATQWGNHSLGEYWKAILATGQSTQTYLDLRPRPFPIRVGVATARGGCEGTANTELHSPSLVR